MCLNDIRIKISVLCKIKLAKFCTVENNDNVILLQPDSLNSIFHKTIPKPVDKL